MKYKHYTKEEDELILKEISSDPSNLSRCFANLSLKLNRPANGISYRWYNTLSKRKKNLVPSPYFIVASKHSKNINRKISREDTLQPTEIKGNKEGKWKRILKILFNLE